MFQALIPVRNAGIHYILFNFKLNLHQNNLIKFFSYVIGAKNLPCLILKKKFQTFCESMFNIIEIQLLATQTIKNLYYKHINLLYIILYCIVH